MALPSSILLDDKAASALAAKHLSAQLAMLRDLTDFGLNLLVRSLHSSQSRRTDVVTLGIIFKHLLSCLDATNIAISAGAGAPASLPARAMLEAWFSLAWVVANESDRRAAAYYVAYLRERRHWARAVIPGTAEYEAVAKTNGDASGGPPQPIATSERVLEFARNEVDLVEQQLTEPDLAPLNREFDHMRAKKKGGRFDPNWYEVLGTTSVRNLAEKAGLLAQYQVYYDKFSKFVHASEWRTHARVQAGELHLTPIRSNEGADHVLMAVSLAAFGAFRSILSKYRPDEIDSFNRIYSSRWRSPFLSIPSFGAPPPESPA